MKWSNVKLIFSRELRDQLRDRRTLFTVAIMPILLYPLLGMAMLQMAQFMREHPAKVWVLGIENLPQSPALFDGEQFAEQWLPEDEARLLTLELATPDDEEFQRYVREFRDPDKSERSRLLIDQLIQQEMKQRNVDAALFISAPVAEPDASIDEVNAGKPKIHLFHDSASDNSKIGAARLARVVGRWKRGWTDEMMAAHDIPVSLQSTVEVEQADVGNHIGKRVAAWSKILPFIVIIWSLTGAFYPAIDLCAGEKERGTFETLLSSPAERSEIALGKLATVMTFSMATSVLNLFSMAITGMMVVARLGAGSNGGFMLLGMPPIASLGWLLLALIPISALFSAVALAAAAFARSSKEGQYYLVPLLMFSMPLMMVPILPGAQLDLGTALIPVSGLMLLLRGLMEGQYAECLKYAAPVVGVTLVCCWASVRWVIYQFNSESVLFRASERFGLSNWLQQVMRDRHELPSLGNAILCGLMILVIKFFVGLAATPQFSWTGFSTQTVTILLAAVCCPALLMAVLLTRNPRKSLRLRPCTIPSACAAVLAATCLNPLITWFTAFVMHVYPPGPEMLAMKDSVAALLADAPGWWAILLVFAVAPAVFEELAYRGFILSGMESLRNRWQAIILTSLLFGVAHSVLQQTVVTSVVGVVLGIIAIQTRSLLPCVLFHATHNGITVGISMISPSAIVNSPLLSQVLKSEDGTHFQYALVPGILMSVIGVMLVVWFLRFSHEVPNPDTVATESRFQRLLARLGQ